MTTLVIGIDGASRRVLTPLEEAGAVPTISRMMQEGASGTLESPMPASAPSAWPSLYTGMNPGKHGVFGFLDFDGYDWGRVDASMLNERPIWEILDHYGLASVVVNVPVTHPPRPFEGALVPGLTAPATPRCHPEGLLEDVRAEIGGYRVYPNDGVASLTQAYRELIRMRGAAFRYLTTQFAPDFGFVGFYATDSGLHEGLDDVESVRTVYQAVDQEIDATIDACRPDNVFVLSVHGTGDIGGYDFKVNEYLRNAGFVEATRRGVTVPTLTSAVRDRFDGTSTARETRERFLPRFVQLLTGAASEGPRIGRLLESIGLDEFLRPRRAEDGGDDGKERVDFSASEAYVRSPAEWGVRINLAGREPDGVVPREDYFEVRDEVMSVLSSARTPDGEAVFSEVAPKEDYYDGVAADNAVDIVTIPTEFDHVVSSGLAGSVFGDPGRRLHRIPEGVLVAAGSAVEEDAPLDGAHLLDVTPTILATFDVPAAEHMDGSTLPIVGSSGVRIHPQARRRRERLRPESSSGHRSRDLDFLEWDT